MKNEFELKVLSKLFYEDYPNSIYPEILTKKERPYTCLMFEINDSTNKARSLELS